MLIWHFESFAPQNEIKTNCFYLSEYKHIFEISSLIRFLFLSANSANLLWNLKFDLFSEMPRKSMNQFIETIWNAVIKRKLWIQHILN